MATQTFHPRLSGENLAEVKKYAAEQGICETSAIPKLLAEGRAARTGKSIPSRWALADPQSIALYSQQLKALYEVAKALRESKSALARPRPVSGNDLLEWLQKQKVVDTTLVRVESEIRQICAVGKMLPLVVSVEDVERAFDILDPNVGPNTLTAWRLCGAFLGKETSTLPPPKKKKPAGPVSSPAPSNLSTAHAVLFKQEPKQAPVVPLARANFDSLIPDTTSPAAK